MRITEFPMLNEVKEQYQQVRRSGKPRQEAVEELKIQYRNELSLSADDDGLLFWVGLADAQFACKELALEVAEKARDAIEKLRMTEWEIPSGDLNRRLQNYSAAPMEERKQFGKSRKFRCTWAVGDTFAYLLAGEEAKKHGLDGCYMVFRKVDEAEDHAGRIIPIVTFTMWGKDPLPKTAEEFQTKPLLILYKGLWGCPQDKSEYRCELLFTSKRQIEKLGLIYLGNFADIPMPSDEIIFKGVMLSPGRFEVDCCAYWTRYNKFFKR